MPLVALDPEHPDPGVLSLAAEALRRGDVIAAPSDTVYGFLARPGDPSALERLRALKSRAGPFLILVADWDQARRLTTGVDASVWERLGRVWPGPVTAVLPAAPGAPASEAGTVALRMPRSTFLVSLLGALGTPLLSTSANPAGRPAPLTASQVLESFGADVALILDGGPAASAEPSTLVDLTGPAPRILRRGAGDPGPLLP